VIEAAAKIPCWLPLREAVARVAHHYGYPTENALLRIIRKAKVRPVRARGRTAEGSSKGWSLSPLSGDGYAIDLDSDVELCLDDMIAGGLLPPPGEPEGPVERAWWPAVEAAAYRIKGAPIEWPDWTSEMVREKEQAEIDLGEDIAAGVPARGRKSPGAKVELMPASDLRRDMVNMEAVPVNLLHLPKVVVRIEGTVGISPPRRGDYIGPPWCSIEIDSAALRQARPKPLIAREPAAPAEPPPEPAIAETGEIPATVGRAPEPAPHTEPPQVEPEPPPPEPQLVRAKPTHWQRDRTIEAIKTLHPPDGIRPKGVSITALTNRINKLPQFKENRVSEDTVGRALKDIKTARGK